ncbi:MAG: DNA polymerase I [Acutalibacteraceae bacterium]|nr:DNA polymerase I [Acutalibacteraceae bacterium]
MKLLALDGNSIINRAFYGIKLLTTKDGRYTNAIYGFINILNRLTELEKPDGIAIAFDLKKPTFRHKMYSEYKAGRKGMPEELAQQLPVMKEWLTLAGYTCIECETYEADDILGTLAYACEKSGDECVIATGDRDSLQLISDSTRVLLAATKMGKPEIINYDKAALFEKYGLTPPEMIELKSLMGDSSDNIPGVAGVGEKTATDLISRFHSIDYIYENLDTIDIKDGVRKKLTDGKESAYLSRELGTICKEAPINGDISFYKTRPRDDAGLSRLMTSLEFFKLMEKMGLTPDSTDIQTALDFSDAKKFTVTEKSMPTDTADIYIEDGKYYLVFDEKVTEITEETLENILNNGAIKKRVYDYKNLYKEHSCVDGVVFDAMLAAYLINPSASSYSADRLISEYATPVPEIEGESDGAIKNACLFSVCCDRLERELKETNQRKLLDEIELPLAKVLGDMELYGFLVDVKGLENLSEELHNRIEVIEKEIYSLVGYEFNLNSPKQLGVALFERLGLPAKKKTKSGYSTNAEVLESLRYAHPAVGLLLEYRQLAKLKSTYADGLQVCVANDGRIHSTFNQTEARTGRISSLEPNLQNIPVRTAEGRRLRGYFTAPDGRVLCDADYSQIELRVLASIANDKNMIDAFKSGTDIHTVTASQVFGLPVDMVTSELRSRAKAVNFGIVYGIGAFSLSKDIGVTRAEADSYIKNYLATYPWVAQYMEKTIEDAKRDGFVTTLYGRRRRLPELSSSNGNLRAFGERAARNAPIQGTAADIIKLAMIRVFEKLKNDVPTAKLILQVHDELIVECDEKDADKVCILLETEMENAADLAVRLTADAHSGKTWLEAKG